MVDIDKPEIYEKHFKAFEGKTLIVKTPRGAITSTHVLRETPQGLGGLLRVWMLRAVGAMSLYPHPGLLGRTGP